MFNQLAKYCKAQLLRRRFLGSGLVKLATSVYIRVVWDRSGTGPELLNLASPVGSRVQKVSIWRVPGPKFKIKQFFNKKTRFYFLLEIEKWDIFELEKFSGQNFGWPLNWMATKFGWSNFDRRFRPF